MDKELIAMCDCPEIQENILEHGDYTEIVARDGSFPVEGDTIYLPSVSWLLREIEVGDNAVLRVAKLSDGYMADIVNPEENYRVLYSTGGFDVRTPLVYVLMWQKGKVWKNKWVNS